MYVAVKGGEKAIDNAHDLLAEDRRGDPALPEIGVEQISEQLGRAVDRVMTEGSVYDPELAALAIKQAQGDLVEAIFLLGDIREIELGRGRQPMIGIVHQEAPEGHTCSVELTTIELDHRRLVRLFRGGWTPSAAPDEGTEGIGVGAPIRGRHPAAIGLDTRIEQHHGALNLPGQRPHLGQLGLDIPKLPCDPTTGVHDHLGLELKRFLEGLDGCGQLP